MQEASKFPRPIKKRNAFDSSTDEHDIHDKPDGDGAPGLKLSLGGSESVHAWRSGEHASADARAEARDTGSSADARDARETPPLPQTPADGAKADAGSSASSYAFRSSDSADADATSNSEASSSADYSYARASDVPSVTQFLKLPLLALVTVGSVLVATWSFTTLENTRAQLASANEAKASVAQALAEAQGRLAAAEKAVADVKAALSAAPLSAEPAAKPEVPAQQ